jgi:hypothetical protein
MIRCITITLLLFICNDITAQSVLPVIQAKTTKVSICDGDEFLEDYWVIMPEVEPDVYHAGRGRRAKTVSFYTDVDSISFQTEPDRVYDFAIVLNGKDTAYTRISTQPNPAFLSKRTCTNCPASDTLPFTFGSDGKTYLEASFNQSPPLSMMFDLGSDQVVISDRGITNGAVFRVAEKQGSVAFGGTTDVESSKSNRLQVGTLVWDSLLAVKINGADGDGIIGYNVFEGKVIEINYDQKFMVVHHRLPAAAANFAPMEFRFKRGLPFIKATLRHGSQHYTDYFEFDGGSNGSLWLNQSFAAKHGLYSSMEKIGTTISRGLGGKTENQTVLFPAIEIGPYKLTNVPVDIELPGQQEHLAWGIFGMDVLKRFNVIIDFQKDSIYLKPNSLLQQPYRTAFNGRRMAIIGGAVCLLLIFVFFWWKKRKSKKAGTVA